MSSDPFTIRWGILATGGIAASMLSPISLSPTDF
jgi:hypothetical protein